MSESFVARRRHVMRTQLGRVAIELFAGNGFDAVTVDQIAVAAGTSQRTFFRYFASKDDVVLDYARRLQHRLVAAFEAQPCSLGAVQGLRQAYAETAQIASSDRAYAVKLGRILSAAPGLQNRAIGRNTAEQTALIEIVARRMSVPAESTSARTVVAAMASVVAMEYQHWIEDGGKDDPVERIVGALDVVITGLGRLEPERTRETARHA